MALEPGQEYWPLTRTGEGSEPDKQVGIVFFDARTGDLKFKADKDIETAKFGSWMKNYRLLVRKNDVSHPKRKK